MSDITIRCRICWVLPGEPHAAGCPVPSPATARASEPTREERAALVEAINAGSIEAWLRGGRPPPNRGGRPKAEKDLP